MLADDLTMEEWSKTNEVLILVLLEYARRLSSGGWRKKVINPS